MNKSAAASRRFLALIAGAGLLVSVVMVVMLAGDFRNFQKAWGNLQWKYAIWLLPLAIFNLALRYLRWEILLKHVSGVNFRRSTAAVLFSAGSLFIFTPGRAGEVAKSFYVRDFFGIPVSRSLPVLIVERLSDILVMSLLAGAGLLLTGETPGLMIGGVIAGAILVIVLLRTSISGHLIEGKFAGFMRSRGLAEFLNQASAAQVSLLSRKMLAVALALGAAAWVTESVIFFLSLSLSGARPGYHLFVLSLAFFPLASLAGSLSFLPGGLGVTEGGLVALGVLMGGLASETAILGALFARAAISGMYFLSGVMSLPLMYRLARNK